jgi:hypothetical protein
MAKVDEDDIRRIDELVRRIDQIPDQEVRETATELIQSVLALHGAGLDRMLELAATTGASGEALIHRFANDQLVSSLLVLHNLHPEDLASRVRQVLAKQSVQAELVSVFNGVVRVRVAPGCHSNGDTAQTLESLLRDAVPDAAEILVEQSAHQNGFVPLGALDPLAERELAFNRSPERSDGFSQFTAPGAKG